MTYSEKLRDPRWQKKRLQIFERDGWKCRVCGKPGKCRQTGEFSGDKTIERVNLDAHHIQERTKDNYLPENGISVCEECHLKAEQWHISKGISWIEGFHPNDLYKLINSSWRIDIL